MRKTSVEAQSAQGECRRHVTVIRDFIVSYLRIFYFILFSYPKSTVYTLYCMEIYGSSRWIVCSIHPSVTSSLLYYTATATATQTR